MLRERLRLQAGDALRAMWNRMPHEELTPEIGPAWFTIANTPTRLANLRDDPWAGFRAAAVRLPPPPKTRSRR